jgi:hypothetical protein
MIFSWLVMLASVVVVSAWVYSTKRTAAAPAARVG